MTNHGIVLASSAGAVAALLAAFLIWMLRPALLRVALAKPNARSSHRIPTPQGAGIAVIAATLATASVAMLLAGGLAGIPLSVFAATLFIAAVGFADDIKPMPVLPRLLLQIAAVAAVVLAAPADLRILQDSPFWLERGLLLVAGLWFVNLVNFMDGLDLMTVAEAVPVTAAIVLVGGWGEAPLSAMIMAGALCGALLGFAPFNRPVAKIFLGDVGSLPIGLLMGWCLLQLAWHGHWAAALLLPLYYLCDATATLLRRLVKGERFWAAHRSHFYQQATDKGFTVRRVVGEVFALNLGLALLALLTIKLTSITTGIGAVLVGGVAVAFSLRRFSRP
jgi:UDP-N-acetylmuramyl pentapeptide phosphotransferase/UDP-N-acetylglucosamine-1-phosphate transferase